MARRKRKEENGPEAHSRRDAILRGLRLAGWILAVAGVAGGGAFFVFEWRRFLSSDPRFVLAAEDGPSASLVVEGNRRVPRAAVLRVFAADRGHSVADVDLERRRQELRRIDWVRDAAVRRVWPDRILVRLSEREPVAMIQVPAGISGRFGEPLRMQPALIDAEGVILPMNGPVQGSLPLLLGVRQEQDVEERGRRVRLMLRVLRELAPAASRIPEVDLTDPENVRVSYQTPEHLVLLVLGNERYLERLNVFLSHYEAIRDRLSHRAVLDLTTEGRITLVEASSEDSR
jgi:cell division protein FtsQ